MPPKPLTPEEQIETLQRRCALIERALRELLYATQPDITDHLLAWLRSERDQRARLDQHRNEFHHLIQVLESPPALPAPPEPR